MTFKWLIQDTCFQQSMPENYNFIDNNGVQLYVRHIPAVEPSGRAVVLMNSRSLCVESSMGIPMGSLSYGEYMASHGTDAFLVDMRGFGMSDPIQEQIVERNNQVTNPMTVEKYYSDINAAADYVKATLGPDTEVSIVGFSFLATLVITFGHLYPNVFKNIVSLNPTWTTLSTDPPRGFEFTINDPTVPYTEVSLDKINQRLTEAQPPGQDFKEPVWYEEAADRLSRYHSTFDHATGRWRLHKPLDWKRHLNSVGNMSNMKANLLIITSQYDIENPLWLVQRIFDRIDISNKTLKILPDATHLCIWERSRQTLYKWTQEFII